MADITHIAFVRRLTSADIPWLYMQIDHFVGLRSQLSSSDENPLVDLEFFRNLLSENSAVVFGLFVNNALAGYAIVNAWFQSTGVQAHIDDVVVDMDHRGHGYGEQLTWAMLRYVQSFMPHVTRRKCNLTSSRPEARALYTKMGFESRDEGPRKTVTMEFVDWGRVPRIAAA